MEQERWFLQTLADLWRHEGFRRYAYPDPLSELHRKYPPSKWRWGFRPAREILEEINADSNLGKPWTVGVGFTRGITPDSEMTEEQARELLSRELFEHLPVLDKHVPEWKVYPTFAKSVLANLAFNLGGRLGQFKNTLGYFRERKWHQAAANLEKSLWYQQVGSRAQELVWRLRNEQIQAEHIIPDFSNVISSVTSTEEVISKGEPK